MSNGWGGTGPYMIFLILILLVLGFGSFWSYGVN